MEGETQHFSPPTSIIDQFKVHKKVDFNIILLNRIEQVGQSAAFSTETFMINVNVLFDFLSPYFDKKFLTDLSEVEQEFTQKGLIENIDIEMSPEVLKMYVELHRAKLRLLLKLAQRKNFLPERTFVDR